MGGAKVLLNRRHPKVCSLDRLGMSPEGGHSPFHAARNGSLSRPTTQSLMGRAGRLASSVAVRRGEIGGGNYLRLGKVAYAECSRLRLVVLGNGVNVTFEALA